ncbi:MAG: hypothetical protein NDI59_05490, partial [Lysobacter sp.]|nr:hypothetical protein [Lysobacter sp.]
MKTYTRPFLVFAFDLLAVVLAWGGGMLLRFNFEWPPEYTGKTLATVAVLLIVHGVACRWAGLYRGMWVFASLPDLKRVFKAIGVSTAFVMALVALDRGWPATPRSMLLLYPMMLLMIMGGGRAAWRMWKEHRLYGGLIAAGKPVVVV